MNDLYRQDKMLRNSMDYEGCGVGTGRYSNKEERKEKIQAAKLPLVLSFFALLVWLIIIFFTVRDIDLFVNGEKEKISISEGQEYYIWEAPNGNKVSINVTGLNEQEVFIYYKADDYYTAKPLEQLSTWLMYYGFAISITVGLYIWFKKIFFAKKHATSDTSARKSY